MTEPADEMRARVEDAWTAFRAAVGDRLPDGLDDVTAAGWQVKEMLAHAAFWLETVPAVVRGMFRGDVSALQVTFPSGYVAGDGEWPSDVVHNAREAEWARDQPGSAVLERADVAYQGVVEILATVSNEEVAIHGDYFAGISSHLDEHRSSELAT